MKSFKNAVYNSVSVAGNEGAYTQDVISDKLPEGYYKYFIVSDGMQTYITDTQNKDFQAIVITKNPIKLSGDKENAGIVKFEDKNFLFEEFFTGFHRTIDYQIKNAEDKRNAQFQDKSRTKDINLGRDDL